MALLHRKFGRFKKPGVAFKLYMVGKLLLLVGVGALLATYFPQYDWQFWGWVLVVAALLLKLPALFKMLWK
jgi:hypothetical protein